MLAADARIAALNATIARLQQQLAAASGDDSDDPCAAPTDAYTLPLHVGAVFIILAVSAAGVLSILAGKRCAALRLPALAIALGKTAGTGIVLATALVHMLQPANESLTSVCVPAAFSTDYTAYAYLFAMLAALAVQTLGVLAAGAAASPPAPAAAPSAQGGAGNDSGALDCALEPAPEPRAAAAAAAAEAAEAAGGRTPLLPSSRQRLLQPQSCACAAQGEVLALLSTEVGFTVHSLFIGLLLGVAADAELRTLLVALSFHQFFEGVALGARLLDSAYSGTSQAALALLFAAAAPIGIGAGAGAMSTGGLNTNGQTFLLTQGISDGVCAGILLHIGFGMVIRDFPADIAKVAVGAGAGLKRAAMIAALWGGAGAMAYIGRYL
jgi:zinc transporter 1/2/3